ncbi:MAG: aldolase [Rhodospirillaceae bacterium]
MADSDGVADKHAPKSDFDKRATAEMQAHLAKTDQWSVRQKLALTARMLAREGHGAALAGQITHRGDQDGTMWTARFGLGLDEIRACDFILVDKDLTVLQGEGMANPSNRFHLWIYRARTDVNCVVHTHPPYISALSMIGEPLKAAHMDTAMFWEDCAFLDYWPGPPIGDEEGDLISGALGYKNSILLANHGQLAASATVEEAAMRSIFIEYAAQLQLMAQAAGKIQPIDPKRGQQAHDYRLKPQPLNASFHYYARKVLRNEAACLEE